MAESKLPYLNAYGNITKGLEKIKGAETPERFSQDFLADTLGMTGGGARPLIAYLKRTGFLGSDGVPTEQYKSFRNPSGSNVAAAQALRTGYGPLFKMAESAHKLGDQELKGLIVQATGLEAGSKAVKSMIGSFKRCVSSQAKPIQQAMLLQQILAARPAGTTEVAAGTMAPESVVNSHRASGWATRSTCTYRPHPRSRSSTRSSKASERTCCDDKLSGRGVDNPSSSRSATKWSSMNSMPLRSASPSTSSAALSANRIQPMRTTPRSRSRYDARPQQWRRSMRCSTLWRRPFAR
jgi:hypothetical protein